MSLLLREAMLYAAASAIALACDMSTLWTLVEVARINYLGAACIAFLVGTAVVYSCSITAIFQHRRVRDARVEFTIFATLGVVGLIVNLAVIRTAVEVVGLHYMAGKLVAVLFTFGCNFGLRRWLLFTPQSATRTSRPHGIPPNK